MISTLTGRDVPDIFPTTVNATTLMIIPPTWTVPDAIKIRLGQNTYGRQRAIFEDGHLLLVLHKPPGPDDRTREGVLFWRSPAGEWQFNRGGPGPGGLKRHVQSVAELEAKLTATYEQATSISTLFDLMETLVPLTRFARNMHAAIQTAREAVKGDQFLVELRDLAYEVERNLDLLLEDTRNEIQHRMARKAEEQACLSQAALQASHRLNILAALFFPLTAVASLFGMNLLHGLNSNSVAIFWTVAAVSLALGFFMKGWVLGKSAPDSKDETPPKSDS
ncbi:MAG: CorA family divalent cation transporter [Verrucomicrobiota bacterium]